MLEVNGIVFLVKVHFEERNNSVVSIGRKSINIRISSSLSRDERCRMLLKLKLWARKKLQENPEKFKSSVQKEYKDGDVLKVGAQEFKLNINFKDKLSSSARIFKDTIYLVISSKLSEVMKKKHISTLLSRCVARNRLPKLKEKIYELKGQKA